MLEVQEVVDHLDGLLIGHSVAPMRNQSRDVTHLIWLQRDVTAQVEREEKMAALIAEKEERFSAYMENANEAIWRIDFEPPIPLDAPKSLQVQKVFDNGVFSEANDAVARTYGLTPLCQDSCRL